MEALKARLEQEQAEALEGERKRLQEERERALNAQAERLAQRSKHELDALRARFKMMQNSGALPSGEYSSSRSPSASESELSLVELQVSDNCHLD
jgi:hypothetical protein